VNALWKRRQWREPDGGNLHVRFDEGEVSGRWTDPSGRFNLNPATSLLYRLNNYARLPTA